MKKLLFGIIATILLSFNTYSQETNNKIPVDIHFTTSSSIMSAVGGCYTVQVNVYMESSGTTWLVSTGTAQIGDCKRGVNHENLVCENETYKEDFIINSNSKDFKYCLTDCLKDERIYSSYLNDKNKILEKFKE